MSNFFESQQQAKVSRVSGQTLSDQKQESVNLFSSKIALNFSFYAAPALLTAMLGTYTYPRAVRLARHKRLLRLRNFYAIHVSIAPFLAFIHMNFFSAIQAVIGAHIFERDYNEFVPRQKQELQYVRLASATLPEEQVVYGQEPYGYVFYKVQSELKKLS